MAYEKKPNTGALFVNDKKEKDTHPDRKGDGVVECPCCKKTFDVWLSGWIRKNENIGTFLSLSFKAKDTKPVAPKPKIDFGGGDDIPF